MLAGHLRTRRAGALGQHELEMPTCPGQLLYRRSFLQRLSSLALAKHNAVPSSTYIQQPINDPSTSRRVACLPDGAAPATSVDVVLASLNQEQEAAAKSTNAAVSTVAGPGSGKTRVIAARIAWLIIKQKVPPWNIMAITFTNKAARELKERLISIIGESAAGRVVVDTFHAVCSRRFLRPYVDLLNINGLTRTYTCLDEDDSLNVLCNVLSDVDEFGQMDRKTFHNHAKQFRAAIDNLKNYMDTTHKKYVGDLLSKELYTVAIQSWSMCKVPRLPEDRLQEIFEAYHRVVYRNNCLEFADLISLTVYLLQNHPDILEAAQERFEHVLVDEFQDTNTPQYAFVKLMKGANNNLFVVGDPNQAIYGWRGANSDIMIKQFAKDFPSGQLCYLLNNYRSTPAILSVSESVLSHDGIPPLYRSLVPMSGKTGGKIQHIRVLSAVPVDGQPSQESTRVIEIIQQLQREHGCNLSDIAVLYRLNKISKPMAGALRNAGIPHRVYGEISFFKKADIKDLTAYLTWVINPSDSIAISRVISKPSRGLGDKTLQHLEDMGELYGTSWAALIFNDLEDTWLNEQEVKEMLQKLEKVNEGSAKDFVTVPSSSELLKKLTPYVTFGKKQIEGLDDLRALLVVLRSAARYTTTKETIEVLLKVAKFHTFRNSENDINTFQYLAKRFDQSYTPPQQQTQTSSEDAVGNVAANLPAASGNKSEKISKSQQVLQSVGGSNDNGITAEQNQMEDLQLTSLENKQQHALSLPLERLCEFMEKLRLNKEIHEHARDGDEGLLDAVKLMSLHTSKGQEFRAVIILGMEDKVLPFFWNTNQDEENRLAYVGCTRAKEFLYFTYARERDLSGIHKTWSRDWSPFMKTVYNGNASHLVDWS